MITMILHNEDEQKTVVITDEKGVASRLGVEAAPCEPSMIQVEISTSDESAILKISDIVNEERRKESENHGKSEEE